MKIFNITVLLISTSTVLALTVSSKEIPSPTESQTFLKTLINSQLSHCTLLIFQDRFENSESVDYLLQNTNINNFVIKYVFPTDAEIQQYMQNTLSYHLPSNNISKTLNSPESLPLHFPITVSNYHKRSDPCIIAAMMINDIRPQFIKQVYNLLTPVFIPITRKDVDYYVFLTKPSLMNRLLLMRELPGRIKYKIAIGEDSKGLIIRSVCFFCGDQGSPVVLKYPGEYTPGFDYFPDFVKNLNGKLLRVACPYIRARIEVDPPYKGVMNARRGVWKNLLEEFLNVKFNFTYNMFVSTGKDGKFGGGGTGLQLPNGSWIGVTGDLISGAADFGIVTTYTDKRIKYIDFTIATFDISYLTFVTSEGTKIYSPAAFFWPFDLLMWICVLLSTLVAFGVFILLIQATEWLNLKDSDTLTFARRGMVSRSVWSFKYQIQFILTSYLDQDCVLPTFTPLRTFVAIWLFFTLVLTTIYRTKLVTILAFPLVETLPDSFEDLAYSDYKVGFMKQGDSAYNTLAAGTDPVYVKLVKEMEVDRGYGLKCLEKVVTERYSCIAYYFSLTHLTARNLSESDKRKLVFASGHTYNAFFGIATEGKSIYRNNFGKWLSWTRPFHLQDIWEASDYYYRVKLLKREWWLRTNQTDKAFEPLYEGGDDNLTLKHISGAFVVLGLFSVLAACVFLVELVVFHSSKIGWWVDKQRKGAWRRMRMIWKVKNRLMVMRKKRKQRDG